MRVALRITGQREDAEDVVQETFLRVYEKIGQFEDKSQLSSWVTRITINQALTCLRKRGRAKFVSVDEELEEGDGGLFLDLPESRPDREQCFGVEALRAVDRYFDFCDHLQTIVIH